MGRTPSTRRLHDASLGVRSPRVSLAASASITLRTPHQNKKGQRGRRRKKREREKGEAEEEKGKAKGKGGGGGRKGKGKGKGRKWGQGGIEPPTSSTLRRNHTTRPLSRVDVTPRSRILEPVQKEKRRGRIVSTPASN